MHIPSALHSFLYQIYPQYRNICLIKKGENFFQADFYSFWNDGSRYIVKTYHRRMFYSWLSRKLVNRELRFYNTLKSSSFILPVGAVSKDRLAFVLPWVPDLSLKPLSASERTLIFSKSEHIIASVHRNNISHGDIRLKNFLYDGKELYLIDWVTAISWNNTLLKLVPSCIKKLFYRTDYHRLHKVFSKYLPGKVKFNPPWWYYPGHFFRKKIYRRFKKKRD